MNIDPQGSYMRHHYTHESIGALMARLERFSSGSAESGEEWGNLDWRTFCNVVNLILNGLYAGIEPSSEHLPIPADDDRQDPRPTESYKTLTERRQMSAMMDAADYPAHKRPAKQPEMPCPFCGTNRWSMILPNGRVECFTCQFSVLEATWDNNGGRYLAAQANPKRVK